MLRALAVRSLANWLCVSLAVGVSGSPLLTERNLTVAVAVAQAPKTFAHPGVLLDQNQLDFIKDKVNSGEKQWTDAYQAMLESPLAALDRTANPTATVECGPGSIPDIGCLAETEDALAAYAMSLAWSISGSAKYAEKAISYMNAWAGTIKAHTDSNAPLQAGWAGATWPRAAEIIRYSNAGWLAEDITKFEDMLRNVYLPEVIVGSNTNGNWELVMMEAAIGICIFIEDRSNYVKAMNKFLDRVPAYIYLTSDGEHPKTAPSSGLTSLAAITNYWYGQDTFPVSGIAQETCRDFVHVGYGLASISHVAESSRIQGNDLYTGDIGQRLRFGLGFHSSYQLGGSVPSWLCKGSLVDTGSKRLNSVTEVGYNALSTRLGIAMDNTGILTMSQRPAGENELFVGWETLTHGNNTA